MKVPTGDSNDLTGVITPSVREAPTIFAVMTLLGSLHPHSEGKGGFTVNRCFFFVVPSIFFPPLPSSDQVFMKALFDYDPKEDKAIPCKEAGLAFKKGSILQIMSQDDATWWQAKLEGEANPRAGLIPSKQFQER